MQIVTQGVILDIDGLACIVAYAELLNEQGTPAVGVTTSNWNTSITHTIRSWNIPITTSYEPQANDRFTLVDVTEPHSLDAIITDTTTVTEVIDHHPGSEAFWQEKIGDAAQIELVGAASTLVTERWQKAHKLDRMSQISARLLISGILDNTLNFKATLTTERDHAVYKALLLIAQLPADWPEQYFKECQAGIVRDLPGALEGDTKIMRFPDDIEITFGQLVVWDATPVLAEVAKLSQVLKARSPIWCINIIDISSGVSHIICEHSQLKTWLASVMQLTFKDTIANAGRLWLRKEIIMAAREHPTPMPRFTP